jgi:hypothetical protein
MKLHRVFISLPLIALGLIAFVPLFWSAVQLISGDLPKQQPARLATTPYATMPAPTPMTTPLVSDHVLLQDARVDTEAARLDLALTQEAAQAEADRIAGIIYATDSQRALELARIAQQQELERQEAANRRFELVVSEEEGRVTREAEQAAIIMQLNATATAYNQDAEGIIAVAEAQATATAIAAQAATVEAVARRDSGLAALTLALLVTAVVGLVLFGAVKAYPHAVRVITEANMREARVTITPLPIPELSVANDATTAEVFPPTSGLRHVQDSPRPVQDETVTPPEPFLNERDVLTEEDERRIVAAFGTHRALSQTAAAVFGAANGRRSAIVKAVLIKHGVLTSRGERVTA